MNTKRPPHIALILLSTLLALPADAQVESAIKVSPMEFLPLEVGNQWTYGHYYWNLFFGYNDYYGGAFYWAEPGSPMRAVVRAMFELPGIPFYPDMQEKPFDPPDNLYDLSRLPYPRELTIEITHTEIIEDHTYFVFSQVDYNWPPVPNFFLAGQKVRFSDEGTLLFRWNGQDIPFYAFQEDSPYTTPEYPVLQNENLPVEHTIGFDFLPAEELWWDMYLWGLEPPPSLSQELAASFVVTWEDYLVLGSIGFVTGYGLAAYYLWEPGYGDLGFVLKRFENAIFPVSAVIGGQQLEFSYTPVEGTNVQSTTWGQLKARHRQRP